MGKQRGMYMINNQSKASSTCSERYFMQYVSRINGINQASTTCLYGTWDVKPQAHVSTAFLPHPTLSPTSGGMAATEIGTHMPNCQTNARDSSFCRLPFPERPGKDRFGGRGCEEECTCISALPGLQPFSKYHLPPYLRDDALRKFALSASLCPRHRPFSEGTIGPQTRVITVFRLRITIYGPSILSTVTTA